MTRRTTALSIAAAALLLPLGGCLISGHSNSSLSGKYVGPSTFGQIEEGKTTVDWVRGVLGEPSSKTELENGSEVWKYAYTRSSRSRGGLFLVFGTSRSTETVGATYVQLRDGVVEKAWRD